MNYADSAFIKTDKPISKYAISSFTRNQPLKKFTPKPTSQTTISNNNALEKSIVLIGPVGAGKSLVSEALSRYNDMPVIELDDLRFANTKHPLLPNIRNYNEMGYDPNIADYLGQMYGPVAWHMYQKKFEIELFNQVSQQLKVPCIISTGGGAPISLEKDYEIWFNRLQNIEPELFAKSFNLKQISAAKTAETFKKFKNRVYLQLPYNYEQTMTKAAKDKLNKGFIGTGQYDKLATHTINVGGLVKGNSVDQYTLDQIVNDISRTINNPIKQQSSTTQNTIPAFACDKK